MTSKTLRRKINGTTTSVRKSFSVKLLAATVMTAAGLLPTAAFAYPIDGYEDTGINRLEFYRLAQLGEISGRQLPAGGKLSSDDISLALEGYGLPDALPARDSSFESDIGKWIAAADKGRYGVVVLDYSDPNNIRYAELNGTYKSNVGSVGKLIAGAAVFQQLANIYPNEISERKRVLRDSTVTADSYLVYDRHKVPLFDVETRKLQHRRLRQGDSGSLWEYLDWMFSASSNGAASMVMQHATLMGAFGREYPLSQLEYDRWLVAKDYREEGDAMLEVMRAPIEQNDLNHDDLRQGSYFTRNGKKKTRGTNSRATPRELMKMLYQIEKGEFIDSWSSLEIKKLMYMTQRRIRYASHPALHESAVYFKSGSLYGCKEEAGFTCGKYKGNRINILASVAIVENAQQNLRYAAVVVSNVLKKNSSVAHQTLALRIHREIEKYHASKLQ